MAEANPNPCAHCGKAHSRDLSCDLAVVADRYLLVRKLGEGGMGRVFEVRHLHMRRRLAMKMLHPHWAADPHVIARFQHEALAAGELNSEYIVAATDFGYSERHGHFLVLEFLDGETLRELLDREGRLSIVRAVRLFQQVCRGLGVAHAAGIVHRDVKPDNLCIVKRTDGQEQVKILDFGIAKLAASSRHTSAGTRMGTLYYMPPEQIRGEVDLDVRADVYSVGVSLFEALSGALPHPGDNEPEVLLHIVQNPPAALRALRPDLPEALCNVVHRAIATNASDRFQSIFELSAALEPFASIVAPGPDASPANSVSKDLAVGHSPDTAIVEFTPEAIVNPAPDPIDGTVNAPLPKGPELSASTMPISRSIPVQRHASRVGWVALGLAVSLTIAGLIWSGQRSSSPLADRVPLAPVAAGASPTTNASASPSDAGQLPNGLRVVPQPPRPTTATPQPSGVKVLVLPVEHNANAGASATPPPTTSPAPLPVVKDREAIRPPNRPQTRAPKARPGQHGAVFFDE